MSMPVGAAQAVVQLEVKGVHPRDVELDDKLD